MNYLGNILPYDSIINDKENDMAQEAKPNGTYLTEQVITDVSHAIARVNEALDKDPSQFLQELLANLQGGEEGKGNLNLMGLLSLLGGLNGQEEGENPLTALFASTYEQYLNGNGEDIPGLIPTSEKALQDIQQAYEFALHGGGEDDQAAMGILPAKETALLEIEKQKVGVLQHIESAGKKVLSEINEAVDKAISARIGGIVSYVAGIIGSSASGGRGGSSGNYTAR